MSTKAVIAWLTLAVLMGLAALVLLRVPTTPQTSSTTSITAPPIVTSGTGQTASPAPQPTKSSAPAPTPRSSASGVPAGQPLLVLSPSQVRRITVARPGAPSEIVERPAPGSSCLGAEPEWILRTESAAGAAANAPASPVWPVQPARVQALLRVLAESRSLGEPDPSATLGDAPVVVTISSSDGSPDRELRLAQRTLAGSGVVEVRVAGLAPRRALVPDSILNVFVNPGPKEWRERTVALAMSTDPSRITLESPKQRLSLGRSAGRWSVREPVSAPADPAGVQRLLTRIGGLQVVDFLDTPPAAQTPTGLDRPSATLTLEADRRVQIAGQDDAQIRTAVLTLEVGAPADASASRVYARLRSGDDARTVLMDARSLAELSLAPSQYIWPHPTRIPAADVGTILVAPVLRPKESQTFARSLTRWKLVHPDAPANEPGETLLADKQLREVEGLLTFLTGAAASAFPTAPGASPPSSEGAERIEVTQPQGLVVAATIELRSLSGQPLQTISIAAIPPESAAVTTGAVHRVYPITRLPSILQDLVREAARSGSGTPAPGASPTQASQATTP